MVDRINYESREKLYSFLIEDYGFEVIKDTYDPKSFGNFSVVLSHKNNQRKGLSLVKSFFQPSVNFQLKYYSDRSEVSVEIACNDDSRKWYSLYFVQELLYN